MEDFTHQLSVKIGQGYDADMVNIRAKSGAEFVALLAEIANGDAGALVAGASAALKGGGAAAALTQPAPAAPVAPSAPAAPPAAPAMPQGFANPAAPMAPAAPAAPPAAPPAPAPAAGPGGVPPVCHHGTKVYRTSKPGAAKQWQAWMCPSPQGTPDQCPPVWIG